MADLYSMQQLSLDLCLKDDLTFANYYAQNNQDVINSLQSIGNVGFEQFIYLWGESGCGRSHLLMATCNYYSSQKFRSLYLPLDDIKNSTPAILENLENIDLLCIDDLEAVLGNKDWEEALFTYFNHLVEKKSRLIVAANSIPQMLQFILPDLQSRMAGGIIFQVHSLDDKQKIQALQMRANTLGIQLPDNVAVFLLNNCKRDTGYLFELLKKLDKESLAARRKLTIPFVKTIID